MSVLLLLTDGDDQVMAVECKDENQAHRIAGAAVWASGGVSAWLVPDDQNFVDGTREEERLVRLLAAGYDLADLDYVLENE